jgi:hypothetical protein
VGSLLSRLHKDLMERQEEAVGHSARRVAYECEHASASRSIRASTGAQEVALSQDASLVRWTR